MTEPTGFLYPFLDEAETGGAGALARDLEQSAVAKLVDSAALADRTVDQLHATIAGAAEALAACFTAGGRLWTAGNGGSATDADLAARLFADPPHGRPLPARSLGSDAAVLTALANDVGVASLFTRQLQAHARPGDALLCFSTSGDSENLVAAVDEARRRGLLTVATAGYDGGRLGAHPGLDHCLVVRADSVHRIQETQTVLLHRLWESVQEAVAPMERDGTRRTP